MNYSDKSEYLNGLLDIPELNVVDMEDNPDTGDYVFHTTVKHPLINCPYCNSDKTVKYGKHKRFLRDLSIRGHRVGILVIGSRHRCNNCNKTYVDKLNCADEADKTTLRLKKYMMTEALTKPFLQIEKELDIKATTVKRYFKEYVEAKEKEYIRYSPKILGIDEAHLSKNMRSVIVDIENHNIIELLKDRKIDTIKNYLSSLPDNNRIRTVTMDMWRPYKEAVYECLPDANIVIDKFHVVKEINGLLNLYKNEMIINKRPCPIKNSDIKYLLARGSDNLTQEQADKLSMVFMIYPELETAYSIKENFRCLYYCDNKEDALKAYEDWKDSFPPELKTMQPIIKTVENWKKEIFNYFDFRYTNAITESLNNLIKHLERAGRGYSFEVLRAKVLFGQASVKPKYAYNKSISSDLFSNYSKFMTTSSFEPKLVYGSGANIEKLLCILE